MKHKAETSLNRHRGQGADRRDKTQPAGRSIPFDLSGDSLSEISATSSFRNAVSIRRALEVHGVDADQLFQDAGIESSAYEAGSRRVPFKQHDAMMGLVVQRTGSASIGLDLAEYMNPTAYGALGVALLCSNTLRNFFRRLERYIDVFSTLESAEFQETPYGAYFAQVPRVPYSEDSRGCHADIFCALTVKFMRIVYRLDYCPRRVDLAWVPPKQCHDRYRGHFGCEVAFGAPQTAIHVDLADLDEKLPGGNAELAFQNDQLTKAALANIQKGDLQSRAIPKIMEYLSSGKCSRKKVASGMNMSESAFQKKLEAAGTSYQEILDQIRAEIAKRYLSRGDMSNSDVAFLLGFNDCSNFARAFRRWVGTSPSNFRKQHTT